MLHNCLLPFVAYESVFALMAGGGADGGGGGIGSVGIGVVGGGKVRVRKVFETCTSSRPSSMQPSTNSFRRQSQSYYGNRALGKGTRKFTKVCKVDWQYP